MGANDGGSTDPIRESILKHQILRFSLNPSLTFLNTSTKTIPAFIMSVSPNLRLAQRMGLSRRELASFDRNHFAKFQIPDWNNQIEPSEVPAAMPPRASTSSVTMREPESGVVSSKVNSPGRLSRANAAQPRIGPSTQADPHDPASNQAKRNAE